MNIKFDLPKNFYKLKNNSAYNDENFEELLDSIEVDFLFYKIYKDEDSAFILFLIESILNCFYKFDISIENIENIDITFEGVNKNGRNKRKRRNS